MKKLNQFKEKEFAIKLLGGFFIIMFVLTMLSRAADSITTPYAKVTSPKNKRLSHEVEVKGALEAKDEVNIESMAGFTIKNIHTKKGDRVSQGDLLVTLDTSAVEDKLLQAEMDLKKIDIQIQQLALEQVSTDDEDFIATAELAIKRIKEDRELAMGDEAWKIERAEEDLRLAEEDLKVAQERLELLKGKNQEEQLQKAEEKVAETQKNLENKKYERDKALKNAQLAIDDAYANYNNVTTGPIYSAYQAVERAKEQYRMVEEDWKRTIKDCEEELEKAKKVLEQAKKGEINEEDIKAETQNIQNAERQIDAKKRALEDIMKNQSAEVIKINRLLEDAQMQLEKAKSKEAKGELTAQNGQLKTDLQRSLLELEQQMKLKDVNKLREMKANGGLIKAPSAGIITNVKAEEGSQTSGTNLMTIVPDDATYEFVGIITSDQEKYIEIGDEVSITLEGEDRPLENTQVDNIVSVPGESGSERKVYVTTTQGEPGMSAKMKVSKDTDKYNTVLPISTLREDQTGQYVFVLREENTTLGQQLVVTRVDVQVIDKNTSFVAVQGSLNSKDQVITESNKTLLVGDRVRLKE